MTPIWFLMFSCIPAGFNFYHGALFGDADRPKGIGEFPSKAACIKGSKYPIAVRKDPDGKPCRTVCIRGVKPE